jgi:3-oxoacyl-[acyl-carrier protein] reductase
MRRIFITGGANGIGRETANRFWERGDHLIVIDRPSLEESELSFQFKERLTYIQADITDAESRDTIKLEMDKGIDVLINNAGVTRDSTSLKMQESDWDLVLNVNLKAVFMLSQLAALKMKEQGSGVILNAASVVAHNGNFGQANYVASKAGLIGMTKTMAKELGKYGIRVNAVAPGFIATAMVKKMPEKVISMMEGKTPLGRMGDPDDIAKAYEFLASDNASFITGTCLNVDGGIII